MTGDLITMADTSIFLGKSEKREELFLQMANRHGLVTGATGTLEAFANIRANAPDTEDVEDLGGGKYRARIPILHAGAWELRLRLIRGNDVFRETQRIEAGRAS